MGMVGSWAPLDARPKYLCVAFSAWSCQDVVGAYFTADEHPVNTSETVFYDLASKVSVYPLCICDVGQRSLDLLRFRKMQNKLK